MCNSLPASVIIANNANTFIIRLDKFLDRRLLTYDYKSTLTGTVNMSFVDNIDNSVF